MLSGMGFDAWALLGCRISGMSNACAWCLGDWLNYGERTFGQRYKTALEATALDYQTLRNYAWVARRFEMSRRRDTLSFQHHAEVASLPEPHQDLWLLRAERLGWSRNELRRRLSVARRRPRQESLEGAVRLRLDVAKPREQRWREAATVAEQTLGDWLTGVVDAAADATLTDESLAQRAEPLELATAQRPPPSGLFHRETLPLPSGSR
jgi:hypothetical protein